MPRVDALQMPMCATGPDIKGFLHAFRGKEEDARVEVDACWNLAQRGGKQERALTSSSDDDSCQM